ncbi:hypothetical protein FNL55_15795 [Tardiphaga sp. vice352]|uniref:hypothetical protein n=1 Tax=Tardiphaga sp. vice352 TaxID=2592816 RepID=UPI001162AA05|nr:hypothetical protein [Tardiphaga sp. vice352]QDM32650.1 hypothetical protein FNL55_15795 [Tardiphaga sp. vice352]
MDTKDPLAIPDMTILNVRTGEKTTVNFKLGKLLISQGDWIETVPEDPLLALKWRADLTARVLVAADEAGIDLQPFHEYATWGLQHDLYPLPATEAQLVLFLLHRRINGVPLHELRNLQRNIVAVHDIANHPPKHLTKRSWDAYTRAISFARAALRDDVRLLDLDEAAPVKALEMFPDGVVPLRWTDVAA